MGNYKIDKCNFWLLWVAVVFLMIDVIYTGKGWVTDDVAKAAALQLNSINARLNAVLFIIGAYLLGKE